MPSLRARLAVASLGAGLLLASPALASAAPGRTERPERPERDPETLRTRCQEAIQKRLTALELAADKLADARQVTDEHEATLAGILADTSASLTSLASRIEVDDLEALKADCKSIFEDHRVFVLILPRTRLVVASDTAGAAAEKLNGATERIESAIARAEAEGADVAQAKADLELMRQKIASGAEAAAGVPEEILGLSPAQWNDDHQVLNPARQDVRAARRDLGEARRLGRGILAGIGGGAGPRRAVPSPGQDA